MGNIASAGSRSRSRVRYLDNPRLPLEIQIMIAEQLCPHCSTEEDAIPATEDARELQRALGNLAGTCKHLHAVANQHRFHSFVMPYDPDYREPRPWWNSLDEDIALAHRFNNSALPAFLDRIITQGEQGQHLRYLSIRNFSLQFKAGVTKARLIRFMALSSDLGIPIPNFVPDLLILPEQPKKILHSSREQKEFWLDGQLWLLRGPFTSDHCTEFDIWMVRILLFGSLPRLQKLVMDSLIAYRVFRSEDLPEARLTSVTTVGIPRADMRNYHSFVLSPSFQVNDLLRRFPNTRSLQNGEVALAWQSYPRTPVNSPPMFPNLRRLVLDAVQPGRLHYLTQVLSEFPNLEELYYHRRTDELLGVPDPNFSNANVFDGVHHCLRRLTYTSTSTVHDYGVDGEDYSIQIRLYEEPQFSDVPCFNSFALLEDLTIDQGLLGRMSTIHDRIESPTGPYYPGLDWKLPQSLRRLSIRYVYDLPQLASQLTALAEAKQCGQFPLLTDIFVVIVRACTLWYDGTWPPQIPLLPSTSVIRDCGELMRAVGINVWSSTTEIDPPAVGSEDSDYPHDVIPVGTLIALDVRRRFFRDV